MAMHPPRQEVSDVIEYAISKGWRVVQGSGHVLVRPEMFALSSDGPLA